MKLNYLLPVVIGFLLLFTNNSKAQNTKSYTDAQPIEITFVDESPPIRDIKVFKNPVSLLEPKVIKNKFEFKDKIKNDQSEFIKDPVVQDYISSGKSVGPTVEQTLAGSNNDDNYTTVGFRVIPPDTQGDVGLDHYVQMVNLVTKIYNKDGTIALGPVANNTFWQGFVFEGRDFSNENDGDPVVLYDQFEDRWIVSHFVVDQAPYYELIAVSTTSDPTGTYYRYAINYGNVFPDYPKLGIWGDGIYISTRDFQSGFIGSSIVGLPKADLYNGINATGFRIPVLSSDYDHDGFLPADADGFLEPPPGTPHYSMFNPGTGDILYIAETTPDWGDPTNSTMVISPITVAPFISSFNRIVFPNGNQVDAHSWALMYRLQYRNYGTHQSMAAIHSVKEVSTGPYGIRWYEFRYPSGGSDWQVHQQGTFLPGDGENRWMGSIAMNGKGDIALGYSIASTSTHPSIRFTGQTNGAPGGLGIMDIPETSIYEGTVSQSGWSRWGDYSMMSVDPSDDETFWYTQEFSNGGINWDTKIAEIKLNTSDCLTPENLVTSNILPSSAVLEWNENGTATSWEVTIGETGFDPDGTAPIVTTNNPYNATGLIEGTTYDWYVRSVCDLGASVWAGPVTFTIVPQIDISVTPSSLIFNVPLNGSASNIVTVSNNGPGAFDLDFSVQNHQFFDDFENYVAGQQLACQNPIDWAPWTLIPCNIDDPVVSSNYSLSGSNSILIDYASTGENVDLVKLLGNQTAGVWESRFNFYIPNGKSGYFNNMASFTPDPFQWAFQCYFDIGGTGRVETGGISTSFSYNNDAWNHARVLVDLDNDEGQLWLNGAMIHSWQWTLGYDGFGCDLKLSAFDFYAATTNDEMYIDDFWFGEFPICSFLMTVNPNSGTIPSGGTMDLTINADGAGLDYGTYDCDFSITSNASNDPEVVVPVKLVIGDFEAPVITVSDPSTIWPPNHKYENFNLDDLVISVEDNVDGDIPVSMVVIDSVSSDEPDDANGNGDGKTKNDIVIYSDCKSVNLRKERSGNGNGRVYTVHVSVSDAAGNIGTAVCLVTVPHNNNSLAVDDGPDHMVYSNCSGSSPVVADVKQLNEDNNQISNYPNPFNGKTTIIFNLEITDHTILKVYDTFGKEVTVLFNGVANAGQQYMVEFNAGNLPEGIYLLHLQSGNEYSTMTKMVLTK